MKSLAHSKSSSSFLRYRSIFFGTILLLCILWSVFSNPWPGFSTLLSKPSAFFSFNVVYAVNRSHDPPEKTFYDDPKLSYTIEKPMSKWDEKRKEWLKHHPTFFPGASDRVLLITGSQPTPCKNPFGDHLLLRFFKNKVDYCRIHGCDVFYSNAFLHSKMKSFWAKIPIVRAAMIAHPETEWIWWVDSDAILTDMEFMLPLEKYKNHNFVVHGWPDAIYKKKSWVSLNAGIFLIRNCQWSMEFLEVWAGMGPQTPNYGMWGKILSSTLPDKMFPASDDQSALVYLLLKEKDKWGDKIYVENEYDLHGYWVSVVGRLDNITARYTELERRERTLRRRHAESVTEGYGVLRQAYLKEEEEKHYAGGDRHGKEDSWKKRRPFITHFTGCQPCSGDHNPSYVGDTCWVNMERALNFADDQVLLRFGFVHPDLENSFSVEPVPFDYPSKTLVDQA